MNVLIIEDELPAQQQILRLLAKHFPELKIAGIIDSLTDAAKWLKVNTPDIIFMDVELSDGNCFELFKMVEVKSRVIVTTAYEQYALNAFKAKAIDYLLKPIEDDAFVESVNRCVEMMNVPKQVAPDGVEAGLKSYKQRFTITLGSQIVVVDLQRVAYFVSENKSTYLVTLEKKEYVLDEGLDAVEAELDPKQFYRIARNCIASLNSIDKISKFFNQRLKVSLKPEYKEQILVSRARVPALMDWLEGKCM
jgi:two-component system LytT family response regulator